MDYTSTDLASFGRPVDPVLEHLQDLEKSYARFVEACDPQALEILSQTDRIQLPAGSILFRENDPCHSFLWILDGCVRVFKRSSDGREVTLYRVEPGGVCILTLNNLLGGRNYPAEAVAETHISGLMIGGGQFLEAIEVSPRLRHHVMQILSERLQEMVDLVSGLAFQRLDLRLANMLGKRFDRNGGDTLEVTHIQLARELGTTREVISRILKEFEHHNCVKLARGRIRLLSRRGLAWFARQA